MTLRTSIRKKIVTIPREALVKTERSTYVFKLIGEKVKKTAIEVESEEPHDVVIRRGVAAGDVVVVSQLDKLKDGTPVELQIPDNE